MSVGAGARAELRIVRLFPDLLGTYGDDGNALVLARRAGWRGVEARVIDVTADVPVPDDGHVYLIGGGEDGPQTRAAALLAESGALLRAIDGGAALLAICAGFQIMGASFLGPDGHASAGLGLLDVETVRGTGPRIVGEVVVDSDPALGVGTLTGYENHAGVTVLGRPHVRSATCGSASATVPATPSKASGTSASSPPTSTAPPSPGTPRSRIASSPGRSTSSRTSSSRSTTSGSRPSGPNACGAQHVNALPRRVLRAGGRRSGPESVAGSVLAARRADHRPGPPIGRTARVVRSGGQPRCSRKRSRVRSHAMFDASGS